MANRVDLVIFRQCGLDIRGSNPAGQQGCRVELNLKAGRVAALHGDLPDMAAIDNSSQLEAVGKNLRGLMSWVKKADTVGD